MYGIPKRMCIFVPRMKKLAFLILLILPLLVVRAQTSASVDGVLKTWFQQYEPEGCRTGHFKLVKTEVDAAAKTLVIHANSAFGEQPFRPENVEEIYDGIRSVLPSSVNRYQLTVMVDGMPIDDLVPSRFRKRKIPMLYTV